MANTSISEWRENAQITLADGKKVSVPGGHKRRASIGGVGGAKASVLFLLGRPGSGKSTIAKGFKELLQRQGREVVLFDDFLFLQAKAEVERRLGKSLERPAQFCQTAGGGFKVLDTTVLEQVLCQLNTCIYEYLWLPDTVILVEFARSDYLFQHVWQCFGHEVRTCAHYVYCDADFELCVERVQKRAQVVAPEVMFEYYRNDGLPSLFQNCCRERIEVVSTSGTILATHLQIARFLDKVFARPVFKAESAVSQQGMPNYYKESGLSDLLVNYRKRGGE